MIDFLDGNLCSNWELDFEFDTFEEEEIKAYANQDDSFGIFIDELNDKAIQKSNEENEMISKENTELKDIRSFEIYLNKIINYRKDSKVPKNTLDLLYKTFKDHPDYSEWPKIKTTLKRNRELFLAALFLKADIIMKELEQRPQIFLKPVLEYVIEKEKNRCQK